MRSSRRRVEQRDRRVDHRVAVLQRGLEDALGLLDRGPDVLDQVVQPVGARSRQPREIDAGLQLEEDVDDARLGDPHRVRQRARLADDVALVVELEPGGALEGDRPRARARADQHRHAVRQVRPGQERVRLGAVGRADEHHELGAVHRLAEVVPGVPDRGEALEIAGRGDPAGLGDRPQVVAELRRRVQRHLMAVLGEVERRRDPTVARSEYCDAHPLTLDGGSRRANFEVRQRHRAEGGDQRDVDGVAAAADDHAADPAAVVARVDVCHSPSSQTSNQAAKSIGSAGSGTSISGM